MNFKEIAEKYNPTAHPRVKSREKKPETVFNDFVNMMGSAAQGGVITEDAFINYYANINAALPAEKDDYFVDVILSTWGLNSDKTKVDPRRLQELEDIIFEKIR